MIKLKLDFLRTSNRHKARTLVLPRSIHPWRDWWIALVLFVLIVLAGSGFLAHLYLSYQSINSLVGAVPASVPRYQEEVVMDSLKTYQARQRAYEAYTVTAPVNSSTTATSSSTSSAAVATTTHALGDDAEAITTPSGHSLVPSLAP